MDLLGWGRGVTSSLRVRQHATGGLHVHISPVPETLVQTAHMKTRDEADGFHPPESLHKTDGQRI